MRTDPRQEVELDLRIAERVPVADDVVALVLRRPDGGELPAWTPGAHVDLHVTDGIVRQYSLCGDPADGTGWRVAVLREERSRGGSSHVHDVLHPGRQVRVRGPRNHFALEPAPGYVFVAGGIGITPILPMVRQAEAAGARWRLLYGGRRRTSMAFLDELAAYDGAVQVRPHDEHGLLDLDAAFAGLPPGTKVYCCGPEALLAAVEERAAAWPDGTLHVERFVPKVVPDAPGPAEDPAAAEETEVELAGTGQLLTYLRGQCLLEVIEAAGVPILSSCREGTCGTCETGVLEGDVEHRDSLLSPAEQAANDVMFPCVSRPRGKRLVLDL